MFSTARQKISDFFSHFIERYKPAIITLLVLAGGYFFYVNVIVSGNEDALKERSFRGLNRMAANIAGKMTDYAQQNAANFLFIAKDKNDSVWKKYPKLISRDYGLQFWQHTKADSVPPANGIVNKEGWKIFFREKADTASVAYAPVFEFVSPFLRRDLFDAYFLAYGDTVLFDELNLSNRARGDFLTAKSKPDTSKTGALQAGQIQAVNIGGREYKLFHLSFSGEGKRPYTLAGYLPLDRYDSEKRYIPTYALIWMVIGLLLVLLMFPLLKIFLMQKSEQLLARNAIASMAALHVLAAVAVLIAINVFMYFTISLPLTDRSLKKIALETKDLFLKELDASLAQMKTVEDAANLQGLLQKDSILSISRSSGPADDSTRYPYFQHVAWANDTGMQQVRWTTQKYLPRKIDVSNRDYFLAVKNGTLWQRGADSFYLTAVASWVSKEKLMVVAKKSRFADSANNGSNRLLQMNMSGPFRSLFNSVVPDGYGFCLVRPNGDVLFHQDQSRSLNENLLDECSNDGDLQALLVTRSKGYLGSRYSGSTQRFYVLPVEGLPFSVVVYRDMRRLWSEDLDVITACSILCLMNLAVILLAILIVQISGYRNSLLQNQSILFTWLRPNEKLRKAYQSVSVYFLLSIGWQAALFFCYSAPDRLCLIGVAFSYSFVLLSYMYHRFAIASHPESDLHGPTEEEKRRNRQTLGALYATYGFTTLVFLFTLTSGHWWFLLSQGLLAGSIWLTQAIGKQLVIQQNFRWWYTTSLFSFVAATAITPILIFYSLSYKEERLLSLKHTQLSFASELARQQPDTLSTVQRTLTTGYAKPYHFSTFAQSVNSLTGAAATTDDNDAADGFESLYRVVKPAFSPHSRQIEFFTRNRHLSGEDFHWHEEGKTIRMDYRVTQTAWVLNSAGLSVRSLFDLTTELTELAWRRWPYTVLFFLSLVLLLLGFLYLLKRLVGRIFFEGYDDTPDLSETDLPYLSNLVREENIFVMGPVNSGKLAMAKKLVNDVDGFQIVEADFARLTGKEAKDLTDELTTSLNDITTAGKRPVVMLRHFEVGINDFLLTEKKLKVLETFLQQKRRIVVLSARSTDNMLTISTDGKTDLTERWSNAMNQFYNLYHHWQLPNDDEQQKAMTALKEDLKKSGWQKVEEKLNLLPDETRRKQLAEALHPYYDCCVSEYLTKAMKECVHSDFLWNLLPTVFMYIQKQKPITLRLDFAQHNLPYMRRIISRHFTHQFEQVCLKIQALSANYYLALWQSLTRDEQRTLLDIGTDDMVNPANRDVASRLANLGLVIPEEDIACYTLMNRSFRNFVFTQLDRAELKTLANDGGRGSWGSFELPVLTVVVALGLFLFTTQKDAFTDLLTYLGAAAAGIGALLKVLGMIPSNKS